MRPVLPKQLSLAALAVLGTLAGHPLTAQESETAPIAKDFPGWTVDTAVLGDLDGDARPDVIVSLKRGVGDHSEAALAVYLHSAAGWVLKVRAPRAVCMGCGGAKNSPNAVIGTPSLGKAGVFHMDYWGGSRETWNYTYKWRLDKKQDRFALIGLTEVVVDTLAPGKGGRPAEVYFADMNLLSGQALVREKGRKAQTCAVPPGLAALNLADLDVEKQLGDLPRFDKAACTPAARAKGK